jgi:hypothetical protein
VPGLTPTFFYDVGSDGSLSLYDEVQRTYTVGNDLKHPRVDEFNVSVEQQIGSQFKITATGIARDWKNFVNSVLPDAIWEPFSFTNPKTNQPMTLYRWANPTAVPQFTIVNTDEVTYRLTDGSTFAAPKAYRKYRGLMLVFQKALRDRWQAQISYVLSKTTGTISNSTYAGISSSQFETPNGMINVDGPTPFDRRHELKLFGSYQVPKAEVLVSGYWRYLSGWPYTPYSRMPASRFDWTNSINVNIEPRGTYLNDSESNVDMRVEKVIDFGIHRFGVYADFQNLFNTGVVDSRGDRYPTQTLTDPATGDSVVLAFGDPRSMNAGRQITFGGRWSF